MTELIRSEQKGPIFEIVLNRPEKRNAMNLVMLEQLESAIQQVNRDTSVRCVWIRGEGKVFSAGIDVVSLMSMAERYGENWPQRMRTVTADVQAVFNRLERLELPTIALIHGHCLGLGMELSLACDFRILGESAQMGLPETVLGMIPDVGGTTRLARLVGPSRAKELIFSGKAIDARTCELWGIGNRVVADSRLLDEALQFTDEIVRGAPLALGMGKRVIDGLFDLERGLQLEGWAQSQLVTTEDFSEGVQSFAQKRKPEFKGR